MRKKRGRPRSNLEQGLVLIEEGIVLIVCQLSVLCVSCVLCAVCDVLGVGCVTAVSCGTSFKLRGTVTLNLCSLGVVDAGVLGGVTMESHLVFAPQSY